jgi:hypothetical protein
MLKPAATKARSPQRAKNEKKKPSPPLTGAPVQTGHQGRRRGHERRRSAHEPYDSL